MYTNWEAIRQWQKAQARRDDRRAQELRALELAAQHGLPIPLEPGDTWQWNEAPITGPAPQGFTLLRTLTPGYAEIYARSYGRYYGRDALGTTLYEFERTKVGGREAYLIHPSGYIERFAPAKGQKFTLEDYRRAIGGGTVEHLSFSGGDLWFDEEGLLKGLQPNLKANRIVKEDPRLREFFGQTVYLVGRVLVVWRKGAKLRQHSGIAPMFDPLTK